ncbi:MAG: transposase [Anaerolineales bacterium]|nr:transposase [Anaerolineales bacterium]
MKILRAYKTEIDPNNVQRTALLRHAGTARWAYNWGLCQKQAAREGGQKVPTAIDLHRQLNALKKVDFPWLHSVSKCAPQEALRSLDQAFRNFFRRCRNGAKKKGYPKFKSRKRGIGSFCLTGSIRVAGAALQLPRLGKLRLKECDYLPTQDAKILRATLTERAGRWFVSLQVEEEHPDLKPKDGEVPTDLSHERTRANRMARSRGSLGGEAWGSSKSSVEACSAGSPKSSSGGPGGS